MTLPGHLNVPGDWNTQRESLLFYEGSVWYKRSFDYAKKAKTRVFVHFGAANYLANVYLNGEELGTHRGGFTPFDFEITDRVKSEGNFLVLRVNDTRHKEEVPTVNTDWWNYGGITRPVTLVEVPETFIQDYEVQLEKGLDQRDSGLGAIEWAAITTECDHSHPGSRVQQNAARLMPNGRGQFSFPANLTLWSADNPKLYTVEVVERDGQNHRPNRVPLHRRSWNRHSAERQTYFPPRNQYP